MTAHRSEQEHTHSDFMQRGYNYPILSLQACTGAHSLIYAGISTYNERIDYLMKNISSEIIPLVGSVAGKESRD